METNLKLHQETGNLLPAHQIHLQMSVCCNIVGGSTKALEHAEHCAAIAERLNEEITTTQALMVRQLAHLVVGDWSNTRSDTFRSLEGDFHLTFCLKAHMSGASTTTPKCSWSATNPATRRRPPVYWTKPCKSPQTWVCGPSRSGYCPNGTYSRHNRDRTNPTQGVTK